MGPNQTSTTRSSGAKTGEHTQEWQPGGEPTRLNVHDFADPALGEFAKAISYGVYDIANDEGWVSVGDVADTAEFAVESIRRWWNQMGKDRFPHATRC